MSWLTVAEAKAHLGKSNTADDEELFGFIEAAEAMIDRLIGKVRPDQAPTVEWTCGPRGVLILQSAPVCVIVSVEQNGDDLPERDLDTNTQGWYADPVDLGGGLIRHTQYFPYGNIKVTYHPGRPVTQGNIRLAGLELVAHLWQMSQRGQAGSRPDRLGASTDEPIVFRGFALPQRVRELLGLGNRDRDEQLVG